MPAGAVGGFPPEDPQFQPPSARGGFELYFCFITTKVISSNPHSAVLALMTKDYHTFSVGKISVPTFSNFSIIILRFWRNIRNWNSQIFPNIFLRQYLNSFSLNQASQFRQHECSVANNLNLFNNILRFVFRVTHLQLLNNIDRKPFLNNLISPDVPLLSCLFVRLHLG